MEKSPHAPSPKKGRLCESYTIAKTYRVEYNTHNLFLKRV